MDNAQRASAPVRAARSLSTNLARLPVFRALIYSRWPIFLARAVTLAGFLLTITAGFFGSVVGSHNFAIIFVWIAWWTLLKLFFIPLGGRSWCSICPIPMPGEWISQRGIFPTGQKRGLGLKWPRKIGPFRVDGAQFQSMGFLAIGLFSAVTLTTPQLTGWVLLGILVLATVLALVFEGKSGDRRPFCNHLCPIGGFTGLYAQAAPVEVRVLDRAVCAAHAEKTCYQACPWGVYVAALQENGPCGMCFECVRACPNENVAVNLRSFGKDFLQTRKFPRLDETFLALVMLGCALAFSAVFLGPWGWLRRAAYAIGSSEWLLYGAGFLVFAGLIIPGLWAAAVRIGMSPLGAGQGKPLALRAALARFSRPLLPLGLCGWIAFTISFAFAKASYVLPVLSDPFGRGWDLFGTLHATFNPDVSWFSPLAQSAVLLVGMLWSARIARRDSDSPRRALAVQGFCLVFTLALLILLVG